MSAAYEIEPNECSDACPSVLIVEDEVLIRLMLGETLRQEGYRVAEAADGDEATQILDAMPPPDLLITDVRMPGSLDGLQLARRVRQANPKLKVIVTSGHALEDSADGLADIFLRKPYDLEHLARRARALTADE